MYGRKDGVTLMLGYFVDMYGSVLRLDYDGNGEVQEKELLNLKTF